MVRPPPKPTRTAHPFPSPTPFRPTRAFDFRDHGLRRRGRTAAAVACAAEIIDDQPGTARRECQRMLATEAIAGTGDDGDAILERNHAVILLKRQCGLFLRTVLAAYCVRVIVRVTDSHAPAA